MILVFFKLIYVFNMLMLFRNNIVYCNNAKKITNIIKRLAEGYVFHSAELNSFSFTNLQYIDMAQLVVLT